WVGQECRSPVTCISTEDQYLCKNGGICTVHEGETPTCDCGSRFIGATCEEVKDPCKGVICQNAGSCRPLQDSHFCYCQPGYTGSYCESPIDECALQNPCQQGSCIQETGQIRCVCTAGWTGECVVSTAKPSWISAKTLIPVNMTTSVEVKYPACKFVIVAWNIEEIIARKRSCTASWNHVLIMGHVLRNSPMATRATVKKSPCGNITCMNGGTCTVKNGNAVCLCPPNYTGTRCEIRVVNFSVSN
ncbi:hypothetical protein GCK32_016457, partial [Trichostrongylus colubriformis]